MLGEGVREAMAEEESTRLNSLKQETLRLGGEKRERKRSRRETVAYTHKDACRKEE